MSLINVSCYYHDDDEAVGELAIFSLFLFGSESLILNESICSQDLVLGFVDILPERGLVVHPFLVPYLTSHFTSLPLGHGAFNFFSSDAFQSATSSSCLVLLICIFLWCWLTQISLETMCVRKIQHSSRRVWGLCLQSKMNGVLLLAFCEDFTRHP